MRLLKEYVRANDQIDEVQLMMDSGANISCINAELARTAYSSYIKSLKRPLQVSTIEQGLKKYQYVDLPLVDTETG